MATSLPIRHRRDASTEMIRTKVARRKSITWKENRYKKYEQNRHFGLIDVNTTTLEERTLPPLEETFENVPEKDAVKPKLTVNSLRQMLSNQRKEMLQQYKEKKILQKMKEQRERPNGGVFKVGLYKPDPPQFLRPLPGQKTVKPEPKKAIQTFVRITRSKTKDQMEQSKIYVDQVNNGHSKEAVQPGQKPTFERQSSKERKALQTDMRMTRSAAKQIPKLASSLPVRRPVPKPVSEKQPESTTLTEERPPPVIELKAKANKIEDLPSKVGGGKTSSKDPSTEAPSHNFGKSPIEEIAEFLGKNYLPETNVASQVKGKSSFAPENFVFQPLDSLVNYRMKPISPQKEHMAPSCFWSPLQIKDDNSQELNRETLKESKTHCNTPTHQDLIDLQSPPKSQEILDKDDRSIKNGNTKMNPDNLPLNAHIHLLEINEHQAAPQRDVPYFRNILQSETERLTGFCHEWEKKLTLDIPDDAKDLIRTTVGQTRLLISERFKQFEGLVNDCEYKRGQKKITCMDLDGFWDMVNFQVEDVNKKFEKLTKLQESEWQEKITISQKVIRKKAVPVEKCKLKQDDAARTAARNRLAALKASMREKLKHEEPAFEIVVPVVPKAKEIDKIVFDAGFFRIESPVKSFSAISASKETVCSRSDDPVEHKTPENKK